MDILKNLYIILSIFTSILCFGLTIFGVYTLLFEQDIQFNNFTLYIFYTIFFWICLGIIILLKMNCVLQNESSPLINALLFVTINFYALWSFYNWLLLHQEVKCNNYLLVNIWIGLCIGAVLVSFLIFCFVACFYVCCKDTRRKILQLQVDPAPYSVITQN